MGKIVVTEYISLDGVIEAPGGTEDYRHVNWAMEFSRGPEGDRFMHEELRAAEAFLFGRVTYEEYAKAWPTMQGEYADRFNAMPKYVVSSTLADPEWSNTIVLTGAATDEAAKLRRRPGGDVVVQGSSRLAQALFEHDLVDELRLLLYPIVLGTGKRLFGDMSDKRRWGLSRAQEVGDGITILVYQRVRESA
jgi:dihydrofolate reductase